MCTLGLSKVVIQMVCQPPHCFQSPTISSSSLVLCCSRPSGCQMLLRPGDSSFVFAFVTSVSVLNTVCMTVRLNLSVPGELLALSHPVVV